MRSFTPARGRLLNLVDSLLLLAVSVVALDVVWIICSGYRWGFLYPCDLWHLGLAGLRNIACLAFCGLSIFDLFRQGVVSIKKSTAVAFLVNCAFMALWFGLSPSPAFTDWQYAIRHGFSTDVVLVSFVTSHIIGKSLSATVFLSLFEKRLIK